jgi:hypothetical protein
MARLTACKSCLGTESGLTAPSVSVLQVVGICPAYALRTGSETAGQSGMPKRLFWKVHTYQRSIIQGTFEFYVGISDFLYMFQANALPLYRHSKLVACVMDVHQPYDSWDYMAHL